MTWRRIRKKLESGSEKTDFGWSAASKFFDCQFSSYQFSSYQGQKDAAGESRHRMDSGGRVGRDSCLSLPISRTARRARRAATRSSANRTESSGAAARSASCRRLAATAQGYVSRRAAESVGERSRFPPFASRTAAALAREAQSFFQPASTAAATIARQHGKMGAPDSATEGTGAQHSRPDAATSPGPAAHGDDSSARFERHASCSAGTNHQFRTVQEHVLAARARDHEQRSEVATRPSGESPTGSVILFSWQIFFQ
jgi:hypothetical protein